MNRKFWKEYNNPKILTYGYTYKKLKGNIPALVIMITLISALKAFGLIIGMANMTGGRNNHIKHEFWVSGRR